MSNKTWTIELQEDPVTGECILEFPPEVIEHAGWAEGDTLTWEDVGNGSYSLTKKQTQWVLVDCVSTFRQRYMVEVPVGIDDQGQDMSLWALDTVTMNEAKEFSQEHIGEQIVSHRVVSYDEAIALCDKDNDYTVAWNNDLKVKNFFTTMADQEQQSDNRS